MTTLKKTIDGYLIELEIDFTQDPPTQCDVTYSRNGQEYFSSLAQLMDNGYLLSAREGVHKVPSGTEDKITKWAIDNGY